MPETIEGTVGEIRGKIAIVVSRYNDSITKKLLEGALETLRNAKVSDDRIIVAWVPGAWELPIVVDGLLFERDCVAAIALGAVIRGETSHDQHINRSVSSALMQISIDRGKPVGFGLLTVNSLEQAIHRAGGNVGNKGEEATSAVLETLRVLHQLAPQRPIGLQ